MNTLSIHVLMHVPYEGIGCIEQWICKNKHSLTVTKLYENPTFPYLNELDWLIIMGGPMSVSDEDLYPWLIDEKIFIRNAIQKGKTILGICLGSQLIAQVLGAKVYPNKQKEIGWFHLEITEASRNHPILNNLENQFQVFHWHGDTFDLPSGSIHLFQSETCINQAFLYKSRVLGIQFHLEATFDSIKEMVNYGRSELIEDGTVQSETTILAHQYLIKENNKRMFTLLDILQQNIG